MRNLGSSSSTSSRLRSAGKLFIAAEVVGFLGCYVLWRKLNRDQDFRYEASHTYPPLLEAYYSLGETIDPGNKIRWGTVNYQQLLIRLFREYDEMIWRGRELETSHKS